jgi:hypothetical protein
MIYREYTATLGKRKAVVGILGEQHYFRPEELAFAEEIVDEYDSVAFETGVASRASQWAVNVGNLVSRPFLAAGNYFDGRSNKTGVYEIARAQRKEIIPLGDDIGWFRGALYSLDAVIELPLTFLSLAKHLKGVPETNPYGEKGELKRYLSPEFDASKGSLNDRMVAFIINAKNRDKRMALVSHALIAQGRSNLLISNGIAHGYGVARNLANLFDGFELVDQDIPDYS